MKIVKKNNIYALNSNGVQYIIGIDNAGYNRHLHWGEPCDIDDFVKDALWDENSNHTMLDQCKQELSVFGGTMYRDVTVKATFADGCRELDLELTGDKITDDTLALSFKDKHYPLELTVNYQLYDDSSIMKKYITVKNTGEDDIVFERLFSGELSLPGVEPYTFRNTNGAWGGENVECKTTLEGGYAVWESHRGSSNHNNSPFFIAYNDADEDNGRVFFGSLAYSGNFKVSASRDLFGITRVHMGMNDFDFSHTLRAGEEFSTPVIYFGTAIGLGEMSRQMNRFAINHVLPKQFNDKPLPVLYNSWEATEFDVSAPQQIALAEIASKMGVELFVMDDGWFGQRANDRAGLGDWYVNKEKFPNGLNELIDKVNELGMDFGLWVEPEMVNPDSDLYRNHPEWAYHYDTREAHTLRNQLVLNMTKPEVKQYIFDMVDDLLTEYNIKYIKWDMNRPFSEIGAENLYDKKMYSYLHTMAVYDIVDELKAKHPDVQIEACASGGGRSELGAMSHFDMVWTSDNTDAVDRMTIQRGYSLLRPTKAMRAWVTDINWYNTPCSYDFRFNIAMQGSLGIGGNLVNYSKEDIDICKRNIALYKEIRPLVQFGDLYRLLDHEVDEVHMNEYVAEDKSSAVVFIASRGTRFYKKRMPLILKGLDKDKKYTFTFEDKEYTKSGAYLMNVGIEAYVRGTDYNRIIVIKEA